MDESVPAGSPQASDDTSVDAASAPTAAIAKAAAEDKGHMQQDQQDHAVGAGEPGPFAGTADDGSLFSTPAATTTTTVDTDSAAPSGHATGEHKESIPPTDLAASPRSGATGFVAPSSYLRPLAVTRDREGPHRTGNQPFTASESGAKRPMHPLDREQREGLVSEFLFRFFGDCHAGRAACKCACKEEQADCIHSAQSEPSSRSARPTMFYR